MKTFIASSDSMKKLGDPFICKLKHHFPQLELEETEHEILQIKQTGYHIGNIEFLDLSQVSERYETNSAYYFSVGFIGLNLSQHCLAFLIDFL